MNATLIPHAHVVCGHCSVHTNLWLHTTGEITCSNCGRPISKAQRADVQSQLTPSRPPSS